MNIDEMIEVLQAYKDGKVIQAKWKANETRGWFTTSDKPKWNFEHLNYRVKPEPRECWLFRNYGDSFSISIQKPLLNYDESFKVREVIE